LRAVSACAHSRAMIARACAVLYLVLASVVGAVSPAGAEGMSVGFVNLSLTDPVEGGPMRAWAVYPSTAPGGTTELGPFTIEAVAGAPAAPGRHPLVVFSHGTGGAMLGHHDSMTALARAGFVAAAVEHPRDNYRDQSGFGTDLQVIGRVHHMVALIDGALADPRLAPQIDRARIGVAGFSAGGYTALLLVGAKPNLALFKDYCKAEPDDPMGCVQAAQDGAPRRRKPDLEVVSDPRVHAAFVMAPAIGYIFDKAGLADVHVPIRLYRAGADQVLRYPWNAERIRRLLPTPPEYEVIEGAGHYVFLPPCSPALAAQAAEICTDAPGIDRAAIHKRLNAEMVAFFRKTLGETQ
jgi:predicted dienelactone hydrolase